MKSVNGVDYMKGGLPRQSDLVDMQVDLAFYDEEGECTGKVIRCDLQPPFLTLVQVDDGRVLCDDECMMKPALSQFGGDKEAALEFLHTCAVEMNQALDDYGWLDPSTEILMGQGVTDDASEEATDRR